MAASVRLSRHPLPREQPRQPRAPLQRDERVGAAYQRALSGDRGTARPTAEVEVRASSASQNVKPSPEVLKAPPTADSPPIRSAQLVQPTDTARTVCFALHCKRQHALSPHAMTSAARACADTDYPGAPGHPPASAWRTHCESLRLHSLADGMQCRNALGNATAALWRVGRRLW